MNLPNRKAQSKLGRTFLLVILIVSTIAVVVIGFYIVQNTGRPESVCGNNVCEKNENCFDCPQDCKCPTGKHCSENTRSCVAPACGNQECELFEDPSGCCIDCGCWTPGEVCNMTANICQKGDIKISDQEVKEAVINYYKSKGITITPDEIIVEGVTTYKNKLAKQAHVKINEIFSLLLVTEEKEVIEIHI